MDNETFLLITGILVLIFLILTFGLAWALKEFASFYVAITVFNYIRKKIEKFEKK